MPKMLCKCGQTILLQKIPNENEYKFISDNEFDKYDGEINAETLYMNMKSFVECVKCGRLWFFWNGYDKEPQEYLPMKPNKKSSPEKPPKKP